MDDDELREVDTFWLRVAEELRVLPLLWTPLTRVPELTLVPVPVARRVDTPVEGEDTTEPGRELLTALPGRMGTRLPAEADAAAPVP